MTINMKYFDYGHLPVHLQTASSVVHHAAWDLMNIVPEGPEKTAGYRKLLEAKDCFVRAMLDTKVGYPVPCKRNTMENCDCGQCTHSRNYPR